MMKTTITAFLCLNGLKPMVRGDGALEAFVGRRMDGERAAREKEKKQSLVLPYLQFGGFQRGASDVNLGVGDCPCSHTSYLVLFL